VAKPSSIELLPEKILEEVNRLVREKATGEEIVAAVADMGVRVSSSAVGRYKKSLKDVSERLRRSQDISNAVIAKLGKETESKAARMNIELMHAVVTDILLQAGDGETITLDAGGAMSLAKALDHLSKAKKTDEETIRKARSEAAKDAVKAATETGKQNGLTAETIDKIKRSILGINDGRN